MQSLYDDTGDFLDSMEGWDCFPFSGDMDAPFYGLLDEPLGIPLEADYRARTPYLPSLRDASQEEPFSLIGSEFPAMEDVPGRFLGLEPLAEPWSELAQAAAGSCVSHDLPPPLPLPEFVPDTLLGKRNLDLSQAESQGPPKVSKTTPPETAERTATNMADGGRADPDDISGAATAPVERSLTTTGALHCLMSAFSPSQAQEYHLLLQRASQVGALTDQYFPFEGERQERCTYLFVLPPRDRNLINKRKPAPTFGEKSLMYTVARGYMGEKLEAFYPVIVPRVPLQVDPTLLSPDEVVALLAMGDFTTFCNVVGGGARSSWYVTRRPVAVFAFNGMLFMPPLWLLLRAQVLVAQDYNFLNPLLTEPWKGALTLGFWERIFKNVFRREFSTTNEHALVPADRTHRSLVKKEARVPVVFARVLERVHVLNKRKVLAADAQDFDFAFRAFMKKEFPPVEDHYTYTESYRLAARC